MKDSLKKITAYKCKWCGKIFASQKHDCKFAPEKTNCLSCEHCLGVEVENHEKHFVCSEGIYPSIPEIADGQYSRENRRYCVDCGSYKQIDNYQGSKSYAEHLNEIEDIKFFNEVFGDSNKENKE